MFSLQPIHLWQYCSFESHVLPLGMKQLFYLSWEDGLWDLLQHKNIPAKSVILVPEFYCGDVEQNILNHGYKVAHYPASKNLETTSLQLQDAINQYHPQVVVVFHAVGITNQLLTTETHWLKALPAESILIEDSVHRIVDPSQVKLLKPNHFVMDSLRKVVPLQGSRLIGKAEDLPFQVPVWSQSFGYSLQVMVKWWLMVSLWNLCHLFAGTAVASWFASAAEKVMWWGYDQIGDPIHSAQGWKIFEKLSSHINVSQIGQVKRHQVCLYLKYLQQSHQVQVVKFSMTEAGKLRGVPLRLDLEIADQWLSQVRQRGLKLRFELDDSIWSRKYKVVYLPLGPYLSDQQIFQICQVVNSFSHE